MVQGFVILILILIWILIRNCVWIKLRVVMVLEVIIMRAESFPLSKF